MPQREREEQTLWMPETWRTETAAVAVAPTKRKAMEKALKGNEVGVAGVASFEGRYGPTHLGSTS